MRMRRKAWTEPLLDNCGYLIEKPQTHRGNWRALFERPDSPLYVEIGCGKGVSTVQLSHENPDINLVAIDEVRHVLAVTIKNASEAYGEAPVSNLKLCSLDAMYISDTFSAEDKVDRVIINFCNPWDERLKHHKRRLTHPRQLVQYRSFLKDDGEIHFKTDNVELFEASMEYFAACGFEIAYRTDDLHASGYTPNYVSEHERMYSRKGIPIHFAIARMGALPEGFDYTYDGRRIDQNERGQQHRGRPPKVCGDGEGTQD